MADSLELEGIGQVIETALCRAWTADRKNFNDRIAVRLIELMLDRYHFNEGEQPIDDPVLGAGHQLFSTVISDELSRVPADKLVKVLGAVYRSIQRRTVGGSSYLQFVSQFTGTGYDNVSQY